MKAKRKRLTFTVLSINCLLIWFKIYFAQFLTESLMVPFTDPCCTVNESWLPNPVFLLQWCHMNIYEEHPERYTTYPLSSATTTCTTTKSTTPTHCNIPYMQNFFGCFKNIVFTHFENNLWPTQFSSVPRAPTLESPTGPGIPQKYFFLSKYFSNCEVYLYQHFKYICLKFWIVFVSNAKVNFDLDFSSPGNDSRIPW